MEVVSRSTDNTVNSFWSRLSPDSQSEKPWLNYFYSEKFLEFSYKDLLAQANCTAAFLMQQGVTKGDKVVLISGASPFYFVVDLALQYLGAVNISLPEKTDTLRVGEIIKQQEVSYIFVENPDTFLSLGQFAAYKKYLKGLVLCSEEVDDMDPEKLITFESLINRGKGVWREDAAGLRDRKSLVQPNDLYALFYSEHADKYFLDEITFGQLITKVEAAESLSKERNTGSITTVMAPHRMVFRTHSLYAQMILRQSVYLLPLDFLYPGVMNQIHPGALVADAAAIKALYELIPQRFMGQNSSAHKTLKSAATIYKKWDAAYAEGKKPPVFIRMRYSWLQKTLFRYIKKQLGGKLDTLICGTGEIEPKIKDFFRHLGVEIIPIQE